MNGLFPQLSARVFNAPLILHPRKAEIAVAAIAERLGVTRITRVDGGAVAAMDDDEGDEAFTKESGTPKGYDVVSGVAVIEVSGMLVQRTGTLRPFSGMTGYDGLRANLLAAMADDAVKAVVLYLDSPGGEVAGCFDLVDLIYSLRGKGKLIWAVCAEVAYSAAYAIASACDRITVPRTGGVGSIGVICMLVDYSKSLTEQGIAVHFVHAGERKAEASRAQLQGVDAALLKRMKADIDVVADIFYRTVARNRGLSVKDVRSQEADCYLGKAGVSAGLADAVRAPDAAFRELLAEIAA